MNDLFEDTVRGTVKKIELKWRLQREHRIGVNKFNLKRVYISLPQCHCCV